MMEGVSTSSTSKESSPEIADLLLRTFSASFREEIDVAKQRWEQVLGSLSAATTTGEEREDERKALQVSADFKATLEYSLRSFGHILLKEALGKKIPLAQMGIDKLLTLSLWLTSNDYLDPSSNFVLFEDLLDGQTIDNSEQLFKIVEAKAPEFSQPQFLASRSRVVLLRMCIELLKRLSKSNSTVFCGRVLMFLAYVFPLSDRSGVNLKGEPNVSHAYTPYLDGKEMLADVPEGEIIDYNFYKTFWGLQDFFQNPQSVFQSADTWNELSKGLDTVLNAFASNNYFAEAGNLEDFYFTKYLTSSKLLRLQLSDENFRIPVLVQMLILFQTLEHPTPKPSGAVEALSDKQKTVVKELKTRIYALFAKVPNGKKIVNSVRNILAREMNWFLWKKENCKPFEKYPPKLPGKRKINDDLAEPVDTEVSTAPKKILLGNAELSRLWNLSMNEDAVLDQKKGGMPDLREFLEPLRQDLDPSAGIEEEYKHKHNKLYSWKALRLIARNRFNHFSRVAGEGNLEEIIGLLDQETSAEQAQVSDISAADVINEKQPEEVDLKQEESETKEINGSKDEEEEVIVDEEEVIVDEAVEEEDLEDARSVVDATSSAMDE